MVVYNIVVIVLFLCYWRDVYFAGFLLSCVGCLCLG